MPRVKSTYSKCAYSNCNRTSREVSMFRFPVNHQERLLIWVRNSGNKYLADLGPDELAYRYICETHFDPNRIHRGQQRNRLIGPAVPFVCKKTEDSEGTAAKNQSSSEFNVLIPRRVYEKTKKVNKNAETQFEENDYLQCSWTTRKDRHKDRKDETDSASAAESNSDDDDVDQAAFSGETSSYRSTTVEESDVFKCKDCFQRQNGFRYVCLQCEERELCAACQGSGAHAAHYVLRVPRSRTQEEIKLVLEKVREAIIGATFEESEVKVKVENFGATDDPLDDAEKMNDNDRQSLSPNLDIKIEFEEEMYDDTDHLYTDFSTAYDNEPKQGTSLDNVTQHAQAGSSKTQHGETKISNSKGLNTQTKIKALKPQKSTVPARGKESQSNKNIQDLQQSGRASLDEETTVVQMIRVKQLPRVQCVPVATSAAPDAQSSMTVQKTLPVVEKDSNFMVMTHQTTNAQVVREHAYSTSQIGNFSGPARKKNRK